MPHALKRHPDSKGDAASAIDVSLARTRDSLTLRYLVSGDIPRIRLPAEVDPARTDELWKHTVFEAFLRPPEGAGYLEFNFSPSTQWAAYRFTGYRAGMKPADVITPLIGASASPTLLRIDVALNLGRPLDVPPGLWRMALTAIIEEADGAKSYWSLAHPQGKPDFHHADNFALDVPAEPA
jgi:hypothetical protein